MGNNLAVICYFLCFFCPKNDPVNRIEIYGREIKDFFYNNTENRLYQYVERWYEVNTNHKATIVLVDYKDSTELRCSADEGNIHKGEYNHGSSPFVTISHNDIFTGTWSCEVWNVNRTIVIFFRLRVKEMMPPQQILVNHIELNLEKDNDIYTAKYFYRDGETVDVDCISSNVSCTVRMCDSFNVIDVNDNISAWGFGFSTKLKSTHDKKKIKCISDCTGIESVEVTFILQEKQSANKINVKINNQDITQNMMSMFNEYNVHYAYFNNDEHLTIRCDTKDDENNISVSCEHCIYNKTEKIPRDLESTEVTLVPNMISIFKCNTKDESVTIQFQLVSCRNDSQLIVQGLDRDNILSEHRAYKHSLGIFYINYTYEYDHSNSFALSCVVNFKDNLNHQTQHITLKTSENNISSLTHSVSIEPNDKPVMCLLQNFTNKIVAKIWISFRFKGQPVMTSSTEVNKAPKKSSAEEPNSTVIAIDESVDHTDHESNNNGDDQNGEGQPQYELWIPAIVVPILIVVVCVVVVMYKMKIRSCLKRREPEHTYDYCMVNAVTQNHPAQNETEYAVPEGEMQENTLYIHTKDFYAKPIQKSQRQRNKQQSINAETNKTKVFEEDAGSDFLIMNSLYSSACLEYNDRSEPTKLVGENQETSRKVSTNLEMLSDIYSEPINKKEKEEGTYTNVTDEPHYSNKIGGYCVYPTYSEPHIKK